MPSPRFKVAFAWWPIRLASRRERSMEFVGWVWWQRAYLVNNLNHGWIAFLEDQTQDRLTVCPSCKRHLNEEPTHDQ